MGFHTFSLFEYFTLCINNVSRRADKISPSIFFPTLKEKLIVEVQKYHSNIPDTDGGGGDITEELDLQHWDRYAIKARTVQIIDDLPFCQPVTHDSWGDGYIILKRFVLNFLSYY